MGGGGGVAFIQFHKGNLISLPPPGNQMLNQKNQLYSNYRLQALVYDVLPPTTAITGDTTGLWKQSANSQLFVLLK